MPIYAARILPRKSLTSWPSWRLWVSSISEACLTLSAARGRSVGVGLHAGDVVRDVPGALRRILRAAGDLLRRRALLLHGGGDRGRDLVDLADDAADGLDRVDGVARDLLDVGDLLGDLLGRLGGLARQRLHLGGDHGKAAAGLAGACGLDRGVEREQIGLLRDGVDQADDLADAAGGLAPAPARCRRSRAPG